MRIDSRRVEAPRRVRRENVNLFAKDAVIQILTLTVRTMPRHTTSLKICTCRIECEEIRLADGSAVFVCVTCDSYAETLEGRLVVMEERRLTQRRSKTRKTTSRRTASR